MLRIKVGFGLTIGFILTMCSSGVSSGAFSSYENYNSTQILPRQASNYNNQLNSASSYPVSVFSQTLASPPLSQSVSASSASATYIQQGIPYADVSSRIKPGIFSSAIASSFQPSVGTRYSTSVSSASTSLYSVSASSSGVSASSGGVSESSSGVSAISNTNDFASNTHNVVLPSVEIQAQSVSEALSSIPAIKNILTVPIPVAEISNIFYDKTVKVLTDHGHSDPHRIAGIVSQPVNLFDVFTFPLLLNSVAKALVKFLFYEGVEIPSNLSQLFASYIEKSIETYNASTVDSLIEAIWSGSIKFVNTLGFDFLEKSDYLSQLFFDEFSALKN